MPETPNGGLRSSATGPAESFVSNGTQNGRAVTTSAASTAPTTDTWRSPDEVLAYGALGTAEFNRLVWR